MNLCCGLNSTKELRFPAVIDLNLKKIARDASLNNNDPLILSGQKRNCECMAR